MIQINHEIKEWLGDRADKIYFEISAKAKSKLYEELFYGNFTISVYVIDTAYLTLY